jgi:hypothetical protein
MENNGDSFGELIDIWARMVSRDADPKWWEKTLEREYRSEGDIRDRYSNAREMEKSLQYWKEKKQSIWQEIDRLQAHINQIEPGHAAMHDFKDARAEELAYEIGDLHGIASNEFDRKIFMLDYCRKKVPDAEYWAKRAAMEPDTSKHADERDIDQYWASRIKEDREDIARTRRRG